MPSLHSISSSRVTRSARLAAIAAFSLGVAAAIPSLAQNASSAISAAAPIAVPESLEEKQAKLAAEIQLQRQIQLNKTIIAGLRQQHRSGEEIELVRRQLEGELTAQLQNLAGSIRAARSAASRHLREFIFVASKNSLDQLRNAQLAGIELGSMPGANSGDICLKKGSVLFISDKQIKLHTSTAVVTIPKSSVVWLLCDDDSAEVYNFHDSMLFGGVRVTANGRTMALLPATACFINRQQSPRFFPNSRAVAHSLCSVKRSAAWHGLNAFFAEFDLCQAAAELPILQCLAHSNDVRERKAFAKIEKDSAIISSLSSCTSE